MLIKSRKLLPKVAEVTDLEDDLEQDLLSQIEEYRKFKLLGEHLEAEHQDRASIIPKRRQSWSTKMQSLYMTRRRLTSFGFSNHPQEKRNLLENHTTILRDEYKIEDMMVIVKESLIDETSCLQDLFKEAQMYKRLLPSFWQPRVNQNPGTDPRARGEFRRYLSHGKEGRNQEAQS